MVYKALKTLGFAFFPPTCVLCGAHGEIELDLCRGCLSDLPRLGSGCYRCGIPLESASDDLTLCGRCLSKPPYFDRVIAPLRYDKPADWLVQQLKYHARLSHIPLLSRVLSDYLQQMNIDIPDLIIPVPLHARRLRERGFNQAAELARPLAKRFNLPLAGDLCVRHKDTVQQSSLTAHQRASNLRNAFVMNKPLHAAHVAIVDDVVTTGTTANVLAKLLKQNGAERVQVWAVARTVDE